MRDRWGRTSSIIATIAEVNRDRKRRGRPYRADEFNPFAESHRGRTDFKVSMKGMMDALFDKDKTQLVQDLQSLGSIQQSQVPIHQGSVI